MMQPDRANTRTVLFVGCLSPVSWCHEVRLGRYAKPMPAETDRVMTRRVVLGRLGEGRRPLPLASTGRQDPSAFAGMRGTRVSQR